MNKFELIVTQGPYSSFLGEIAAIDQVAGIRLNTVMPIKQGQEEAKLAEIVATIRPKPLWIDLKARQLRIVEFANTPYTAVTISHHISVTTPTLVYFDNGTITGKLVEVDGNRLILEDYVGRMLGPGESVNIIDENLRYLDPEVLTERDMAYLEMARRLGLRHLMLSYTEDESDLARVRAILPEAIIMAKIESRRGLRNIEAIDRAADYLMAARGDLYTEIDYPHQISGAMKRIFATGRERAFAASRMLASLLRHPAPSCPDIMDLCFLKEIGYRHFLLGDDLCFKRETLLQAIRIMKAIMLSAD